MDDYLNISNKNFKSRLIVGTGKYKNFKECSEAIKASGAQIVTVAVRRVNIIDKFVVLNDENLNYLNKKLKIEKKKIIKIYNGVPIIKPKRKIKKSM